MTRRGLSLVELLVVLALVAVLLGLLLPAVQQVRSASAAASCRNNLHQLALALHQYHDGHRALPPATARQRTRYPYLGWAGRVLPYLEQSAAWRETEEDYAGQRSFTRPTPHRNLARPFPVFVCPSDGRSVGTNPEGTTAAFSHYPGVGGRRWLFWDGMLYPDSAVRMADVTDGASNTLLLGERPPSPDNSFGWWYAGAGQSADGDLDSHLVVWSFNRTFRAPTCQRESAYEYRAGQADDMCSTFHFWSRHPGGAHFAFGDGSVRFLKYSAADVLPALATRAGGESARVPD